MRPVEEIVLAIESYKNIDDNWLRLDELVSELWETGSPDKGINVLFGVFERNPTSDGDGVFWSILHGLETLDYERELYQSLIRKPSYMTILMMNRIENSNVSVIGGISISEIKKQVLNNPKTEKTLLSELENN